MMAKRFILLLAAFLSSHVAAAQTPAQHIVPSLAASFPLFEGTGKSAAPFSYPFARAPEPDQSLGNLWPMREVKTLFLTQSSLPLVQVWGGRLQLDGFTSRLHTQNVQLGPLVAGRLQRQAYTSGLRSVGLYGLSLSFHFGRDGSKSKSPFLASSATLQLRLKKLVLAELQ
jgi:hypothetical protein